MLGSRAIWHDGWKAVTNHPTIAGWSNFNDDEWELYHTEVDRSELHNLAAEQPEKVQGALRTSGSPRPARTAPSRSTTARPWRSCSRRGRVLTAPRNRYVYFPDTAAVPSGRRSTSETARS